MPKLPLTVLSVEPAGLDLYTVTMAFADGSIGVFLIPLTLATVDAVQFAALAFGQLLDLNPEQFTAPHGKHRRWLPRS
jgi:hypothetical protein